MPTAQGTVTAVLRMPARDGPYEVSVAKISGELDLAASAALWHRLDQLTTRPRPALILDLSAVTFADCAGLAPLCRARLRAEERGGRLLLLSARPQTLRTLRLTGLAEHFELHDDLATALAALGPPRVTTRVTTRQRGGLPAPGVAEGPVAPASSPAG